MRPASPPGSEFSEEDYYVPAGTVPERRVRGPSVAVMELYGGSENDDLFKAQRARELALRHQSAEHLRVMHYMRRRQKETPVDTLREHIQRNARLRSAKELAPETVQRRAAVGVAVNEIQRYGENASGTNSTPDDGMRHLPTVHSSSAINPDKAKSMAKRVAKQLAKVQSPHAGWETAKAPALSRRKS